MTTSPLHRLRAQSRRTSTPAAVFVAVVLTLMVAFLLAGCGSDPASKAAAEPAPTTSAAEPASESPTPTPTTEPEATESPDPTESATPPQDSALAVLATLPVKGRAPMTGYDRDSFGAAWLDADRNGCDTRNDMLSRDLTAIVYEPGTHDCVVESGILADPYTATDIDFIKGDGTLVDIDHVVALGNAWVTGAFKWEIRKKAAIANDPLNLLPVDASANRQKGDGDAATWLPANKAYRCAYVARQISVKAKYGLWVTAPEKSAMEQVLSSCPDQEIVEDSGAPILVPLNLSEPEPEPTKDANPGGTGGGTSSTYYENCDAVRAAGAAPIRRGDPGYGSHLDRDGDGIACE